MKRILVEKYKKAFILDERFILREDEPQEAEPIIEEPTQEEPADTSTDNLNVKDTIEKLEAFSKELSAIIKHIEELGSADADFEKLVNELKEKADAAKKSMNETTDYSQIANLTNEYLTAFDNAVNDKDLEATTDLKTFIDKIKDLTDNETIVKINDTNKEETVKDLSDNFGKLTVAVENALESSPKNGVDTAELADIAEKLQKSLPAAIEELQKATQVSKDNVAEFAKYGELTGALIESLPEEFPTVNSITSENIKETTETLTKINNACVLFVKSLKEGSEEKATQAANSLKARANAGRAKKDWKAELDAAGSDRAKISAIWDEYYKLEWGENADRVSSLDDAFTDTLYRYGFSANTNPFIEFLKNNLNVLNITADAFAGLVNAYIGKDINEAGLRGKTMFGISPKTNILYCKNLYSYGGANIEEYLEYQANVAEKYGNDGTTEALDPALEEKFAEDLNALITGIFTTEYDITDNPTISNVDNTDRTLKTLGNIREDYKLCFNETLASNKKANADIDELYKKLGGTEEAALEAIKYLIISEDTDKLKLTEFIANEFPDLKLDTDAITLSSKNARQLKGLFDKINLSGQNTVKNIIKGLLDIAKGESKE